MKKLLTITVCGAALLFGFNSSAQSQGDFRASVGATMGTSAGIDTNNGESKSAMGVNVGLEYFFADKISAAPSYGYFFPSKEGGAELNMTTLNVDLRYYISEKIYVLGGFTSVKGTLTFSGLDVSETAAGVNVGVGGMIPMSDVMSINLQVKYTSPTPYDKFEIDQSTNIVAQAGLAFSF